MQRPRPATNLLVGAARRSSAALLILVTVAGTFALTATPFAWILLLAKLTDAFSLPPFVPLVAVLVAIPATMIAGIKLLLAVSDAYERLRGQDGPTGRVAPVWRRGLTDTRLPGRLRMLDWVMVISVCAAVLILVAWFIVFSGSSIRLG